ncbi:MAG: dihydroorotase [Clostridia bacterium]|nr:dihydroorotase [Clostridia bacterium]
MAIKPQTNRANTGIWETTDSGLTVLPGFCDVHVHFREPGFSYKETIATGTAAASHGGYTDVCTMPNLAPVPDSLSHLQQQLDIIEQTASVGVHPYGAITVGEKGEQIADLEALAPYVCAFSDDGRGVQDPGLMKEAMQRAKALGRLIVAHCEVNELLRGGCIHDGDYAKSHGYAGICSESEWRQVERDIDLAYQTGCGYHVCHISTKESAELVRQGKKSGIDVSCETAPHYLLMDDSMLREDGWFKMNPPVRGKADREALLEAVCDGTIEILATDHAPHSAEEKAKGLEKSAFGIVGLETAFPLLYTHLVRGGILTLEQLCALLADNPRKRFGIPTREGDCSLWDLNAKYAIDPDIFLSKGRATPFAGWKVYGKCMETHCGERILRFAQDDTD